MAGWKPTATVLQRYTGLVFDAAIPIVMIRTRALAARPDAQVRAAVNDSLPAT
jgi:hypothetical protein